MPGPLTDARDAAIRDTLLGALVQFRGNRTAAALALRVSRHYIAREIKRLAMSSEIERLASERDWPAPLEVARRALAEVRSKQRADANGASH